MWRPWGLIHPEIKMQRGATVTAVWREAGKHLDLFATGTDGAVWSIWWNDTAGWRPQGWLLIRPEVKMQPGATVTAVWREAAKHLDLFATGTDGAVWSIWWNDTAGWRPQGWLLIRPEVKMQPGATVTAVWREAAKHLDLFATGTDGAVWSIWWNDTAGWRPQGWLLIRPEVKMQPGATVTAVWREAAKHLDLFATGTDGAVWSIWWNDTAGWRPQGWLLIRPEVKMQPGATVTAVWREAAKHLDLFATGTDGAVWSIWWNDTAGWRPRGWVLIHPEVKMRPGATVTAVWQEVGTHLDLFATGADGTVWSTWWEPGEPWQYWKGWWPWFVIDPNMTVTEPSIKAAPGVHVTARRDGDHLDLFMTGTDGAVWSTRGDRHPSPDRGLLANVGVERRQMKGVFFFAGSSKSREHENHYTVRPLDRRHLEWSQRRENRDFAVAEMTAAGVNVVLMSYWGEPGSDRWTFWAPMQTSTRAHDELFTAVTGRNMLIMPVIEGGAATYSVGGHSPVFRLRDEFGAEPADPAPYLVYEIRDLVRRYLLEPADPAWRRQWAQLYDRDGNKRYAIMLMHVAADRLRPEEHERFAVTFDLIANAVFAHTGVRVGFTLDVLVPGGDAKRYYYATAADSGPHLRRHAAVLAVQAFIPEISLGRPRLKSGDPLEDEKLLLAFKHAYLQGWINTDVPVIFDASAGYFATIFGDPDPVKYGNNDVWRQRLGALRSQLAVRGVSFHCWNGYTEGYAAVPTQPHGDANLRWLREL